MQTTVSNRMPIACAGLVGSPFHASQIATRAAEGGSIPFGRGVVAGTSGPQAKLPTADTQKFVGITCLTQAVESTVGSAVPGYREKAPMNVMEFGDVWLPYSGTAPADDVPIFIVASGADAGKAIAAGAGAITAPLKSKMVDTTLSLVLVKFTGAV